MDRVSQVRGGASADCSLDSSPAYVTAEDEDHFYSLSDSTGDHPEGFHIGPQIHAANILAGDVQIFDDNSCDGNELVIDCNPQDEELGGEEEEKRSESSVAQVVQKAEVAQVVQEAEVVPEAEAEPEAEVVPEAEAVPDTEVLLLINGSHVNAIDIGNRLYLYRQHNQDGEEQLAAVQVLDDTGPQPTFKFLKVRENKDNNLEVYEDIVEVEKEPEEEMSLPPETNKHLPISDISKVLNENPSTSKIEIKSNVLMEPKSIASTSREPVADSDSEKIKFAGEARKSPLIGSYTPMTFHSTPNKEGVPLTKTMVDQQLHNKVPDMAKKTIELTTDNSKQKSADTPTKTNIAPMSDTHTNKTAINKIDKTLEDTNKEQINNCKKSSPETEVKTGITKDKEHNSINDSVTNTTSEATCKQDKICTNNKPEASNIKLADKVNTSIMPHMDENLASPSNSNIIEGKDVTEDSKNATNDTLNKQKSDTNKIDNSVKVQSIEKYINNGSIIDSNEKTPLENANITSTMSNVVKPHTITSESSQQNEVLAPDINNVKVLENTHPVSMQKDCAKSDLQDPTLQTTSTDANKIETEKSIQIATEVEEPKSINNNNAVPFGKWTEANRQEFLNKIKESKVATVSSTTNQIKQPNDLNRRDVLKKIGSARQISNANVTLPKRDFKVVSKTKSDSTLQSLAQHKLAKSEPVTQSSTISFEADSDVNVEGNKKTEMFNQDLIDKTIEGILMDKLLPSSHTNHDMGLKNNLAQEKFKEDTVSKMCLSSRPAVGKTPVSLLDDIEQKMNELHGTPFIERPGLQESLRMNQNVANFNAQPDSKNTIAQTKVMSNIPGLISHTNKVLLKTRQIDEDEILECEPVTGDTNLGIKYDDVSTSDMKSINTFKNNRPDAVSWKKDKPAITEKDFDKFVNRNTITYEDQFTVNFNSKQHNVVQTVVEARSKYPYNKPIESRPKSAFKPVYSKQPLHMHSYPNMSSVSVDEANNKINASKLQIAYQSALTEKRQKDTTIIESIEDKPVEVVYLESSNDFVPYKLNVQGPQLTSCDNIDVKDTETSTVSSCDSMDSDFLFGPEDPKVAETKGKNKHQRKQVLSSVETPELELIEPKDLVIGYVSKRKRKTEDIYKSKSGDIEKKTSKSHVPKKTYLLGRDPKDNEKQHIQTDRKTHADKLASYNVTNETKVDLRGTNVMTGQQDIPTNTLDSLVKAAELLENQPDVVKSLVNIHSNDSENSQSPTLKRGRGRPRKYPLSDAGSPVNKSPSPQKKVKLIEKTLRKSLSENSDSESSTEGTIKENWTMGKINANIVCPICNKLFRSEDVVYKHVQHCSGTSPNRSDSSLSKGSRKRSLRSSQSDTSYTDNPDHEPDVKVPRESRGLKKLPKHDEVIVIEDTPKKSPRLEPSVRHKKGDDRKAIPAQRSLHRTTSLACDVCGKTFRQLSYLTSHKLQHKKEEVKKHANDTNKDKSIISCEICHKQFRKLHHLVQHRLIHNQNPTTSRKVSTEQRRVAYNSDKGSAGFRCEICDKSFRKLHHLVEHRETHKSSGSAIAGSLDTKTDVPPQCTICNKTFRKLHHLIEHKETHLDSNKLDAKKSTLVTKDIIHECPLCYMVFPNELSLEKHAIFCRRKKRQTGSKRSSRPAEESVDAPLEDHEDEDIPVAQLKSPAAELADSGLEGHAFHASDVKSHIPIKVKTKQTEPTADQEKIEIPPKVTESKVTTNEVVIKDPEKSATSTIKDKEEVKYVVAEVVPKARVDDDEEMKADVPGPDLSVTVTKKRQTAHPLSKIEITDDDEVRYMWNPDYKSDFYRVSAKKRNSLQIDNPKKASNLLRRISLQLPPRVPRLKVKPVVRQSESKAPAAKSYANKPSVPRQTGSKAPVALQPVISSPLVRQTVSKAPVTLQPVTRSPVMRQSVNKAPVLRLSANKEPVSRQSASKPPVSRQSTSKPPVSRQSTSKPPISRQSTNKPPVSRQSTNNPSVSRQSSSRPPVSRQSASKLPAVVESEPATSTSSDEGDIKYSFPKSKEQTEDSVPDKRKSLSKKNRSLTGIAKRKSLGKSIIPKLQPSKKRTSAEHRCDCGQLFLSVALLSRHHTVAHTPPRVRRRRSPPPEENTKSKQTKPDDSKPKRAIKKPAKPETPKTKSTRSSRTLHKANK